MQVKSRHWFETPEQIEAVAEHIQQYRQSPHYLAGNTLHIYADQLTRALTAFPGIESMINAQANGYRPTLRTDSGPAVALLADLYDLICERRGLPARAYRGLTETVTG